MTSNNQSINHGENRNYAVFRWLLLLGILIASLLAFNWHRTATQNNQIRQQVAQFYAEKPLQVDSVIVNFVPSGDAKLERRKLPVFNPEVEALKLESLGILCGSLENACSEGRSEVVCEMVQNLLNMAQLIQEDLHPCLQATAQKAITKAGLSATLCCVEIKRL